MHIITDRLVEGAKDCFLRRRGSEENVLSLHLELMRFPLCFKDCFKARHMMASVCLGAIVRSGTPHFDYVSAEATKGIANITLQYNQAVSFGVLHDRQYRASHRACRK